MFRYFDPESAPFDQPLPSPDCTLIAPLLTAYFDLEAPGSDAMRVQQHLSQCVRCAQMWRDWGDARLLLQTTPVPAPPHALATQIVQMSRLSALVPAAPLTSKLARANRHDEIVVPPQLQDAILAATTRTALKHDSITHEVVTQRDFNRPWSAAKPMVAMAAVPVLALWLITLTARDSALFAPENSQRRAIATAPAQSQLSSVENAQPLIAHRETPAAKSALAVSQRPMTPVVAAPAPNVENASSASDAFKVRGENAVALASWPDGKTSVALAAPTTEMGTTKTQSASLLTIGLRSPAPLIASPLPAVTMRAKSAKIPVASAKPGVSAARSAAISRPVAPRRSARLSTVSMTTPALSSAMLSRQMSNSSDMTRVVMKMDAPFAQKATLPVAASREVDDEGLWQNDVAPERSALSVVQALNDNRPRELRDAFDAYAQTLMDDGDSSATAL